jgi:hypothetical protein
MSTWLIVGVVGPLTVEVVDIGQLAIEAREEFIRSHLDEMAVGYVVVDLVEVDLILLFVLHGEGVCLTEVSGVGHIDEEPLLHVGDGQWLS